MKKLFTFLLSACMCTFVMAQRPEAVIAKAGDVKPVIDGTLDDLWETVEQNNVVLPFGTETPTLGDEGTTFWKALWDDAGLYIFIVANDDNWTPYPGTGNAYEYDKIELYFDTNDILEDGVGGQAGTTGNRQIAPDPDLTMLNGELKTQVVQGGTVQYAYKLDGTVWNTEWFIPWESIPNKDGLVFDKTGTMGFDVDITDNDGLGRQRAMWANDGKGPSANENWGNMDDAGHVTFEGAQAVIAIDEIAIAGGQEITTDNGTTQLNATLSPVDATQGYIWKITGGTGLGKISKEGIVSAIRNGTILVKAFSADGFVESNEHAINVSGQIITMDEINYLKNGNFDNTTATGGPVDWSTGTVTDGVLTFGPDAVLTNPWDLTLLQQTYVPFALKDEDFTISFQAWADEPRTLPLVMEDAFSDGAQWDAYAFSSDPGYSDKTWTVDLTTEPTVYTLNLNFSKMQETTVQNFNFQVGMSAAKIHLDSIYLVRKADLALIGTDAKQIAANSMKVYPNPVGAGTELNVSLTAANSKVAIYNAVGQKIMEKVASGNLVKFNVSSLRKGMYFVRLDDGTSQKFIK